MRFKADNSRHREILNGGMMVALMNTIAGATMATYTATTKKRTGANASMVRMRTERNSSYLHDRAGGIVETYGDYNLQRELGGFRNHTPERSLMNALRVAAAGADVNERATPRYVGAPPPGGARRAARRFTKGGR